MAMSALGQKQAFALHQLMSALPPKADMCAAIADVCFGPIAEITFATPFGIAVPKASSIIHGFAQTRTI